MNWWNLLILLFFIGGPAIGGILKKIDEQRKLKQIQVERERRRIETLRTGRVEPEPPITQQQQPKRSLQDLADRRKAQLAQLRQQQQQRAQQLRQRMQQQGAGPPTAATTTQPPTRPPVPIPLVAAPNQPAQRRRPSQLTPAQRAEAQRRIARTKAPPAPAPVVDRTPLLSRPALGRIAQQQDEPTRKTRSKESAGQLVPKSAADWRRAIVAKEILSPPVAIRDPSGPTDPIG